MAQVVGAIVAAGVLVLIAKGLPTGYDPAVGGLAANGYGEHSPTPYSLGVAFVVEVVLAALLILTVLGETDISAPVGFAGIAIGLMLTLGEPGAEYWPALFVGGWALSQLWLFVIAPFIGAALAAAVYMAMRQPEVIITARRAEQALESQQVERERRGQRP